MQLFYAILLFFFRAYPENFYFRWGNMCPRNVPPVPDFDERLWGPGGIEGCLPRQVTLRFCASVMMMFLILITMTMVNLGHFAMTKFYVVKLLFPLCLFFPSFLLPDGVFRFIEQYGVLYSLHAFVFAAVFVMNFGVYLNERCVANRLDDFNNGYKGHLWRFTRHIFGSGFLIASIVGTVFLLIKMNGIPEERRGESFDVAYNAAIANICFMVVYTIAASLRFFTQGSFLAASIMTAFLTTTIWGAVTFNGQVQQVKENLEFTPFVLIAVFWLFLALGMSSEETERRSDLGSIYEEGVTPAPIQLDFGVNDIEKEWDCYSEGHGVEVHTEFQKDPEPALRIGRTLLYLLFHLSIPAAFIALSSESINIRYALDVELEAEIPRVFWAMVACSWLALVIYVWVLIAPFFTHYLSKKFNRTKKPGVKIQKHVTDDVPIGDNVWKNQFYSTVNETRGSSMGPSAQAEDRAGEPMVMYVEEPTVMYVEAAPEVQTLYAEPMHTEFAAEAPAEEVAVEEHEIEETPAQGGEEIHDEDNFWKEIPSEGEPTVRTNPSLGNSGISAPATERASAADEAAVDI